MLLLRKKSACSLMVLSTVFVACGKSKSDSGSSSSSSSSTTQTEVSNVANAFPLGMSLAILPTSTSTSLTADGDTAEQTVTQKNAETEKLLKGSVTDCMPTSWKKDPESSKGTSCYEFDQDMIYGGRTSEATVSKFMGTKTGKDEAGEACLASFTRSQAKHVVNLVDQSKDLVAASICQMKLEDSTVEIPKNVGDSLDLSKALTKLMGQRVKTVSKATMERLTDVASRAVYRTIIKISDANGINRNVLLVHSPAADGSQTTYNGVLAVSMDGEVFDKKPVSGSNAKHRIMSVTYAKTSDTNIKYELRTAQVHKDLVSKALTSSLLLDMNVGSKFTETEGTTDFGKYYKADGSAFSQANEAVDAMTFIAFDMNKDTGEGTLSYWKNPGGNYYENARGLNIAVAKDSSGKLAGCATTGSASNDFARGLSIRRYLREAGSLTLTPKAFYHPFFNTQTMAGVTFTGPTAEGSEFFYTYAKTSPTENAKWYTPTISSSSTATTFVTGQNGTLITRQCFKRNDTSGKYEIDTSKITETAGFELVDTSSTASASKIVEAPSVKEAKPLDAKVSE